MAGRTLIVVVAAALGASVFAATGPARSAVGRDLTPGPMDWPTYGHDVAHGFAGTTTLGRTALATLRPAWVFATGDAVTANPIVVGDTVYVGSWDGKFYAINRATGALRWNFTVKRQPAVSPRPGQQPRGVTSDGGLITSAAWFEPARGRQPALVIFGGGYTLYALAAATGRLLWEHDYPGRPERPADPAHDGTRIFSSPAVVGRLVLFGVSADGSRGRRGYVVAADLATGRPVWKFETDVDARGQPRNDGCGGVWASPTIMAKAGLVAFDVADCHFTNTPPYDESVFALHIADGHLAWFFRPPRQDPHCDYDFGATVNLGLSRDGTPTFLGVGGKDGTYYSLEPLTGRLRWSTHVVFGGFAGGFIGTPAYDGQRVYGATALGDFGRFEGFGSLGCRPGDPGDQLVQEPSLHAFDARTGAVVWQQVLSQSFGPTSVAGGMVFVGTALTRELQIRDAATGLLAAVLPLRAPSDSGVVVSGNALYFGLGSSEQAVGAGVAAYTPGGVAPR